MTNVTARPCAFALPACRAHRHDIAMTEQDSPLAKVHAKTRTKLHGLLPAMCGIDLSLAPGETVTLLGPNGADKSTAVDVFLGLDHSDI
jgi:ABC-type sugar transport system ATPase subunit